MNNGSRLDEKLSAYFYQNSETIDELIKLYDEYKKEMLDMQKERVSLLKKQTCDRMDIPVILTPHSGHVDPPWVLV